MPKFTIAESLESGWDITKDNFVILLGAFVATLLAGLLPFIVLAVFTFVLGTESFISQIFASVAMLAAVIIWCALGMGLLKMILDLVDKRPVDFNHLVSCFPLLFSGMVASLITSLVVQIGAVLVLWTSQMWWQCH
jgi:hypothetical protein